MNCEIVPLSDIPQASPVLAYWAYALWYKGKKIDFRAVEKEYRRRSGRFFLPFSWVALSDTFPVGMISLKERDLYSRKDLTPWLSALYVAPEYRRRGIGSELITEVLKKGKSMGYERVYLFIDIVDLEHLKRYYESLGWEFFANSTDAEGRIAPIYKFELSRI